MTALRNLTPLLISPANLARLQADFDERGACRSCTPAEIESPMGVLQISLHVDINDEGEIRATSGALAQVVGACMYPDRFLLRASQPMTAAAQKHLIDHPEES
jgi:hypothetical protein